MEICCAAILFDLDGVLTDSTPAVARVWSQWARERGFGADWIVPNCESIAAASNCATAPLCLRLTET